MSKPDATSLPPSHRSAGRLTSSEMLSKLERPKHHPHSGATVVKGFKLTLTHGEIVASLKDAWSADFDEKHYATKLERTTLATLLQTCYCLRLPAEAFVDTVVTTDLLGFKVKPMAYWACAAGWLVFCRLF